jgi:hypothetical protein
MQDEDEGVVTEMADLDDLSGAASISEVELLNC